GELANWSYQDTQDPLPAPKRDELTCGDALMNTSPCRVPPEILLARAVEPIEVLTRVYPVALWNAGATWESIRSCSDPADNTSTGPVPVAAAAVAPPRPAIRSETTAAIDAPITAARD